MRTNLLAVVILLAVWQPVRAQTRDIQGFAQPEPREVLAKAQVPCTEHDGKIVQMNLSSRRDAGELLKEIYSIGELQTLSLVGARLTRDGWRTLPGFPEIRTLNLSFSDLTDEALVELQSLPHLRHLNLSGTAITDQGLARLREMKELRTLIVVKTRVTAPGAEALRQALPEVAIIGAR
jgi:hypothetical protein